jgi:hypothetical protein
MASTPLLFEASSLQNFVDPTTLVSSTPSWGGNSPSMTPFIQTPFLFPPPRIVRTPVMDKLILSNITFGISIWYLDPPSPLVPSTPTPHLVFTHFQPSSSTPVSSMEYSQTFSTLTNNRKGFSIGGKGNNTRGTTNFG